MKKLLTITLVMAVLSASAGSFFRFYFTDSDGNEWYSIKDHTSVENPSLIATNVSPIGTSTPTYNGHIYSIDYASNDLLMDGEVVGVIKSTHNTVDVTQYYGFAIDNTGTGWIMCQYNYGDSAYYLFSLDLATATATYYDYVGPWCCSCALGCRQNVVNGMVIQQFP